MSETHLCPCLENANNMNRKRRVMLSSEAAWDWISSIVENWNVLSHVAALMAGRPCGLISACSRPSSIPLDDILLDGLLLHVVPYVPCRRQRPRIGMPAPSGNKEANFEWVEDLAGCFKVPMLILHLLPALWKIAIRCDELFLHHQPRSPVQSSNTNENCTREWDNTRHTSELIDAQSATDLLAWPTGESSRKVRNEREIQT